MFLLLEKYFLKENQYIGNKTYSSIKKKAVDLEPIDGFLFVWGSV